MYLKESLFRGGVYASDFVAPRSLYYSVKAKNIGDVVTVVIDEATKVQDDVKLDTSKSSQLQDGFSGLINKLLPGNTVINDKFNGYGGQALLTCGQNNKQQPIHNCVSGVQRS
jgi:flagellar basal body L-ring protein FlgH